MSALFGIITLTVPSSKVPLIGGDKVLVHETLMMFELTGSVIFGDGIGDIAVNDSAPLSAGSLPLPVICNPKLMVSSCPPAVIVKLMGTWIV